MFDNFIKKSERETARKRATEYIDTNGFPLTFDAVDSWRNGLYAAILDEH
jgi:hypothetical protein